MWEYNYYPNSDELYHHGIMGMKWGKRNGPPYPLGVSDHSASEKKAGWRKSLDSDGRIAAAKKNKKIAKKNLKVAKTNRKIADRNTQERYYKKMEEIEKGYKLGQNLSEADQKREEKADKQAQDAWKRSKKSVKNAQKAYKDSKKEYRDAKKEVKDNKRFEKEKEKDQAKFEKEYGNTWYKPYNEAAEKFNRELSGINAKYEGKDLTDHSKGIGKKYVSELDSVWRDIYTKELNSYYKVPETIGKDWVNNAVFMNSVIDTLQD